MHSDQTRAQRRLIEEIEMAIRAANREILGQKLPNLSRGMSTFQNLHA